MLKKVFIIAEAGINHNGDVGRALDMVDAVKSAGADCIKFQTFRAEEFVADPGLVYVYKSQGKKVTESQMALFRRHEFSRKEWKEIIGYCRKRKIVFATTPQNPSDLDFILSLTDMPFIKIGSDDLTNLDLISYYARKKKPLIISAGMAYGEEIADAVRTARDVGCKNITVLHCISLYPADAGVVNLRKIPVIRDAFGVKVGFSDHTLGSAAAVGAVTLGAEIVEKHFTLSHDLPGPDHWFSLDVNELNKFVKDIRFATKALGSAALVPAKGEEGMRRIARRSLVAKRDIKAGTRFTDANLDAKRPGTGISPRFKRFVSGRIADRNYRKGELIRPVA